MGSAGIELAMPINAKTVEKAHAMALHGSQAKEYSFLSAGMRAARAQDPKLLLAMDRAANVLDAMAESQTGQTRREASATKAQQVQQTEAALWREAYKQCDSGAPLEQLGWIYAAAAWLAGLNEGIRLY